MYDAHFVSKLGTIRTFPSNMKKALAIIIEMILVSNLLS